MVGKTYDREKTPFTALLADLIASGASADAQLSMLHSAELAARAAADNAAKLLEEKRKRERDRGRVRRASASADGELVASSTDLKKENGLSIKKGRRKEDSLNLVTTADEPKKRNAGRTLPPDWKPNARHHDLARSFNRPLGWINEEATKMREWAEANANRAVARKANWDLTFTGWLRRAHERSGSRGPRRGPSLGDIARGNFNFGGGDDHPNAPGRD